MFFTPRDIVTYSDSVLYKDSRNTEYPVRSLLSNKNTPVTRYWRAYARLNQNYTNFCVGYGIAHDLSAKPTVVVGVDDNVAIRIYDRAKTIDNKRPDYKGGISLSSGMYAAKELGYYTSYRWAFGIDDVVLSVGHIGPVILGVMWHGGMEQPDIFGRIHVRGEKLGGHCVCVLGYDVKTELFRIRESRGWLWGIFGDCFISKQDLEKLLVQGGVATIPTGRVEDPSHSLFQQKHICGNHHIGGCFRKPVFA